MSTTQLEDADYWKARYEQERERLAKLWLAYKTLENESGIAEDGSPEVSEDGSADVLEVSEDAAVPKDGLPEDIVEPEAAAPTSEEPRGPP